MPSRRVMQRRARAKAKREAINLQRQQAFIAHERAKVVKANLVQDNREVATVWDHLGRPKLIRTTAYSRITDSFVRMVQGGGLIECLNLDRPDGDSDRQVAAFKARHSKQT